MKKLFVTLATIFCVYTASAQKINAIDADMTDYQNVLDASGNTLHCFDISSLLDKEYTITVFINEYLNSTKQSITSWELGKNIDNDNKANKLTVYIVNQTNSTKQLYFDLQNINNITFELALRPLISRDSRYFNYSLREFSIEEFKTEVEIPLLMYGSFWMEEETGKQDWCKFQSERYLSPDMSNEVFKKSPHYYVLSIQFDKAN